MGDIERKTGVILSHSRFHQPKAAVERITLPRSVGGRRLADLHNLEHKQIILLRQYFQQRTERSSFHSAITVADNMYSPLNLAADITADDNQKINKWLQKPLRGRHANDIAQPFVGKTLSNAWLAKSDFFSGDRRFHYSYSRPSY